MKLLDYIIYRLYTVYEKHKDPGRFSAFGFVLYTSLIVLVFLGFYVDILAQDKYFIDNAFSTNERLYILLGVVIFDIVFFYSRYTKKRIEQLKKQFKGSLWNKTIPNSLILMLPAFEIIAGIAIYYLLKKYY